MKFTCERQELMEALSVAIKAVSSSPNSPILSGILIKAIPGEGDSAGEIELRGTNNELYIVTSARAAVEEAGSVILSAKYLYDFCRSFRGINIIFQEDRERNMVNLSSGDAKCDLLTMTGEFPEPKQHQATATFTTSAGSFKKLVSEVCFAAAQENEISGKAIFTGCLLDLDDKDINLVATNTHRLAIASGQVEGDGAKAQTIVPSRILAEIGRIMPDTDAAVTVDISREVVVFSFENMMIATSVIEGVFPDYRRVIPKELPIRATINRSLFQQAVTRASIIAKSSNIAFVVKLAFSDNTVVVSANSHAIGFAEDTIEAAIEGGELTIAFNPDYLADAMKVMEGDEMILDMSAPLKPGIIREPGNDSFRCVITPVRTKN